PPYAPPPPPPVAAPYAPPPPASLAVAARGPMAAEGPLPNEAFVDTTTTTTTTTPSTTTTEARARRRPRWQVEAEAALDTWLPRHARVAAVAAGVVGVVVGMGAAVGLGVALAGEARTQRTLLVRSTPPGASVTVDDIRLDDVTPLIADLALADGNHVVKVALAAGAPAQRPITLTSSDRSLQLSENLQSAGGVRVVSTPAGARILVDGRDVGTAPVVVPSVATDRPHVVEARRPGFKTATASIPAERAAEHVVALTLEPTSTAGRAVIATALPAVVEIDGMVVGASGETEHAVAPGRHDLVVRIASLGIEKRSSIEVPERGVGRWFIDID
ncbi:MAG TPA: PEGA domain-containing protein, partial [Myxococcota bacterium]